MTLPSFLEDTRFMDDPLIGASGGPSYLTRVISFGNGFEQRVSLYEHPLYMYNIARVFKTQQMYDDVVTFFHAVRGQLVGFRLKDHQDYKSCGPDSTLAFTDQVLGNGDGTTADYQLRKAYVKYGLLTDRLIKKPVSGTTVVGINGTAVTDGWAIDTTTGLVTFDNYSLNITAITQAAQAVVTVGAHSIVAGDTVYIASVAGMTEINGARYEVASVGATTITLDVDSTGFTAYSSGGTAKTLPQAGHFTGSITGISKATNGVVTSAGHSLQVGDTVAFSGVSGMTEINGQSARVVATTASTFTIRLDTSGYTTYTSGGTYSAGERVTAGFQFDVPVRFGIDSLEGITFEGPGVLSVSSLPLVEFRI